MQIQKYSTYSGAFNTRVSAGKWVWFPVNPLNRCAPDS
jgi:hypothetical protein